MIWAYLAGSKVSRLTFTRRTPAARRGLASWGSRMPLVVRHSSRTPGAAATFSAMERMFFFTKGSPPVSRTFSMPRLAAAFTASTVSSSVSMSSWRRFSTPSAGMQYRQRRLHSSVTDNRR